MRPQFLFHDSRLLFQIFFMTAVFVFKIGYFLHTALHLVVKINCNTEYQTWRAVINDPSHLSSTHLENKQKKNVTKFQIWIHLVISALHFNLSFLNPSFKPLLSHFGVRLILLAKFGRVCQKNNPFLWVCWGFAIFKTVYYHNSIVKEKNSSLKRKRPHRSIIEVSIMTQVYF